ncbi:MAG TPA: LUD domain-containing protein [Casimicrobiaceae bacterium]|nr:LUD domain-containing protein [Casimicrobiaceae bacterium]
MAQLDQNKASRDAVLSRVRTALGRSGADARSRAEAEAYLQARKQGPRPTLPADLVAHFMTRATDMASTVERIPALDEVPAAVARYLDSLDLSPAIAEQKSHRGVCWPELGHLDWRAHGLDIEGRPIEGSDLLGITGCFCAIAETGTLVFRTDAAAPTDTMLLPATHVAVLRAESIVSGMEEAFARVRAEAAAMPRAINLVSGPSRTGDIEQTIVLGAHGPFRVHILVLG